jgi:hypothetical protein
VSGFVFVSVPLGDQLAAERAEALVQLAIAMGRAPILPPAALESEGRYSLAKLVGASSHGRIWLLQRDDGRLPPVQDMELRVWRMQAPPARARLAEPELALSWGGWRARFARAGIEDVWLGTRPASVRVPHLSVIEGDSP